MESKPHFTMITDPAERLLLEQNWKDNLDMPSLLDFPDGSLWARSDELRLWRKSRETPE